MNKKQLLGNSLLLLTALIWGCAFVAQSVAADTLETFTIQTARSFLATLVLIPVILVSDSFKKKNNTYKKLDKSEKKTLIRGGILCGIALTVATALQQTGLNLGTTAGKSGFVTAMYILIVPILGLFLKKKIRPIVWACVAMGVVGLYLLCMQGGFSLAVGDFFTILCSLVFSVQILLVDYYSPKVDGIKLSCIQFFTMFIISLAAMLIFETPSIDNMRAAWLPICYAGILSSGVAYTLQIIGQKNTEPTVASLLMSFESVFAVIAGIIILDETPSAQEYLGSAVMFAAIIISQLPEKKRA